MGGCAGEGQHQPNRLQVAAAAPIGAEPGLEGSTREVLHDEERRSRLEVLFQDADDVRVVQLHERPVLTLEVEHAAGIPRRVQDLDGHVGAVAHAVPAKHGAEATFTQEPLQDVSDKAPRRRSPHYSYAIAFALSASTFLTGGYRRAPACHPAAGWHGFRYQLASWIIPEQGGQQETPDRSCRSRE
jgi:hypothetical protein